MTAALSTPTIGAFDVAFDFLEGFAQLVFCSRERRNRLRLLMVMPMRSVSSSIHGVHPLGCTVG